MAEKWPPWRMIVCVALLALAPIGSAWAQEAVSGPDQWSAGSVALKLLQALASLAIVIALILLSYYALRRFSWPPPSGPSQGPMRVIQVLNVEPGRRLYLVEVGPKAYLLAWTAESATFIAEVDPADVGPADVYAGAGETLHTDATTGPQTPRGDASDG